MTGVQTCALPIYKAIRNVHYLDQVDLVEVMDIANGLIAHHRVYWGWVGFKALAGVMNKPVP